MRISSGALVLLASIAATVAEVPSNVEAGAAVSLTDFSLVTPPPLPQSHQDEGAVKAREIVQNPGAAPSASATQANPTTTLWEGTTLANGQVVQVPVTYIQTFASVPDQWPSPSSGSVGLGSLSGHLGVTSTITVAAGPFKARGPLKARSEGTLGQTPWIGMAVGLTCTALAAVMLG